MNRESKVCSVCQEKLPESSFTPRMWTRGDVERKCNKEACMRRGQALKACSVCEELLPESSFTPRMWSHGGAERKCKTDRCMARKRGMWACVQCKVVKPKTEFARWLAPRAAKINNGTARCNVCMDAQEADAKCVAERSAAHAATRG